MAVATSPYVQNNYQAASTFQPYKLQSQEIGRAYMAVNQFWEQGASRVKSVYEDALGLKLSLEPNKEIRKNYMEQAEKQLTKLSSMDLSDPSVQRQGINLFKPLLNDEGIIYDDATTRHFDKVRADGLKFRDKDNGKNYSDINMAYAMDGYSEFMNSKDRMAGKKFYENRREYTPYYDYTADYEKALKNCKPSSSTQTSPEAGTGYMLKTSAKFLSAEQARVCIESGVSSQALRQLQIEGSVNYKNNKPALASDTASYLSSVSGNLSEQLEKLAATRHAAQDPKLSPNLKPDERKTLLDKLDAEMNGLTDQIDDNNITVSKLNLGDYSPIDENPEAYAGSVYTYKKLYRRALAASFEEQEKSYKEDPIQMLGIKFANDKYLNALDFNQAISKDQLDYKQDVSLKQMEFDHDTEMKMLDVMYGGKSGKSSSTLGGAPFYKNPITGKLEMNPNLQFETHDINEKPDKETKVYEEINNQLNELNTANTSNNLELYNTLVERGENDRSFRDTLLKGFGRETSDSGWNKFKADTKNNNFYISKAGKSGGIQETSWFNAYFPLNKEDKEINEWASKNSDVETGISTMKMKLDIGESQVAKELNLQGKTPDSLLRSKIKGIAPVTVGGVKLTAEDFYNAQNGLPSPVKIVRSGNGLGPDGKPDQWWADLSTKFVINGKSYGIDNIGGMMGKIRDAQKSLGSEIDSKRKEVYNRIGLNSEKWAMTYDDDGDLVQRIRAAFPQGEGENQLNKAIAIVASDFSGGVKINVPGVRKGDEDEIKKFRALGIGIPGKVSIPQDGIVILRGTSYNKIPQAADNKVIADVAYQLTNIAETTSFKSTQPGQKVPDTDIKRPVYISGKRQMMTIKTYNTSSGQPQFKAYLDGANTSSPQAVASTPHDLFNQLDALRIKYNQ